MTEGPGVYITAVAEGQSSIVYYEEAVNRISTPSL